jgi:hypothetical protein
MKNFSSLILVGTTAGCLLMLACGSDSESTDIATARSGWSELSGEVDGNLDEYRAAGNGATMELACSGGGMAAVDGAVAVQVVPVRVDVDTDIRYAGCVTARGVQIDGDVHFTQKVAVGGGELVRVQTIYTGDVDFSGAVEASCDVDVQVLVDLDGKLLNVDGAFCGQPAVQLDVEITPLWLGGATTAP